MNATAWVIVTTVLVLIGWDVFAAWRWGQTGTISWDIWTASQTHPIIAFAAGLLCGHLFWSQR